jgi:hypothetical protein
VSGVNKLLDDLHNMLCKEANYYNELLMRLQEERRIIYELSSPDVLNENNKKKEVILLQIRLLEESRRKLLSDISQNLFRSPQEITISQIIKNAKEPHLSLLMSSYSKLKSLAQAVNEFNNNNAYLIKQSLRIIQGSLSFLVSSAKATPLYQRTGKMRSDFVPPTMFQREV